jgi:hypothetical protein
MLRVVLGRARPDTEWSGRISGLQFNSTLGAQESVGSRGATGSILTVPRSHHGEEVDLEATGDLEPRTQPLNLEEKIGGAEEKKTGI